MKYFIRTIIAIFTITLISCSFSIHANASSQPSLLVTSLGSDSMQVSVMAGDPNSTVSLHYQSASSMASIPIGTSNINGNLSTIINSTTYQIKGNTQVYVTANGASSPSTLWPDYSNSGTLSLSPAGLAMKKGQVTTVVASVGSNLSVSDNPNPSVAIVSISGSQITVNALNSGSTNMIICASNIGCRTLYVSVDAQNNSMNSSISFSQNNSSITVGQVQSISIYGQSSYVLSNNSNSSSVGATLNGSTITLTGLIPGPSTITVCAGGGTVCNYLYVTVQSSTSYLQPMISFSQGILNLIIGQNQSVSISGTGTYGISNNSNIGVAVANISGSTLNINALSQGSTTVTVCAIGTNNRTCSGVSVSVQQTQSQIASTTNPRITLSQTNLNMTIGQSQYVTITGNGGYYISQNSGQNAISANISGNTLEISAIASGGSNITVCQNSNQCATVYAYSAPSFMNTSSNSPSVITPTLVFLTFSKPLYVGVTALGISDPEVVALQKHLKADGVYSGPITGYFGTQTKAAVQKYQRKNKLSPIGSVGPATRALLNKSI